MKLRPMSMADADKMLEWKNYPETRKFAIQSNEKIKKKDHYKWLRENLKYFRIIYDTHILGAVRVQDDEISIWVDRAYRRMGVASNILNRISQSGMTAKIVDGNVASMLAFINADFKPFKHKKNYYIMKKV